MMSLPNHLQTHVPGCAPTDAKIVEADCATTEIGVYHT